MKPVKKERKTRETDIKLVLDIYGQGRCKISTGIGFFDHMLEAFAFHGCFDLELTCKGDLQVCGHHTVEDTGIVLGQAFRESLPQDRALIRFGTGWVPMDETLARAVVDISGRSYLVLETNFTRERIGDFDTELVREFFQAFANNFAINLHLKILYGNNTHHQIEALFKAVGVALRQALQIDEKRTGPASTKGVLV